MKFLQTFWTRPFTSNENIFSMRAGWLSCEYHWMSWALSCLQAKAVFGEVNLVTDLKGKELLVDRLQLPYSNIDISLEQKLDHYHPSLFALAKIYAYSIQTEPFLHLDSDVFIWQKPGDEFLNSRLFAQNIDKNLVFYTTALNEINEHFTRVPSLFLKENYVGKDVYASNAGIIGGGDLSFFKAYCTQAFEFIDANKDNLDKLNTGSLNFIFEQYLFYLLSDKLNIPVSYLGGVVDDPVFKDYIKFEDFPNVQMAHPVGNFKKYQHVCNHVAKKLRNDYPEYYYRIIEITPGLGLTMKSAVYYSPQFKTGKLAELPAEQTVALPLNKPQFERTQAAINYLSKKYAVELSIALDMSATEASLAEGLKTIPANERELDCLLEIFRIELERNLLIEKVYAGPENIAQLYAEDLQAFKLIQDTFSMPEDDRMKVKLDVADNFVFFGSGWEWKYDYREDIPAIIERNFNEEKASHSFLLVPAILQLSIREFYIDELDIVILDTIKNILTIDEILLEMKDCFSEEEIEADYAAFKQLIVKIIKQLLYVGTVKIIF